MICKSNFSKYYFEAVVTKHGGREEPIAFLVLVWIQEQIKNIF